MAVIARGVSESNLESRDRARARRSRWALEVMRGSAIFAGLLAILLIGTIAIKGFPAINWEFLTAAPDEGMTKGGVGPMLMGSILLMLGTLGISLPVGIMGGVWLAYYAKPGRLTEAFRASTTTLAGTPTIIFGLFGLAIFVLKMKLGFSLLAGWMTLAIFSIPIVVLTTEQSLKSLPSSFEEAALALGLSKWATIQKILLPAALPGILTGIVLTAGRAAGEAPPILLTAGIYYTTEKLVLNGETVRKPVMNLPYHLAEGYRQGGTIPEGIIWGTCLVLMLFVVLINIGAVLVRARIRSKQKW